MSIALGRSPCAGWRLRYLPRGDGTATPSVSNGARLQLWNSCLRNPSSQQFGAPTSVRGGRSVLRGDRAVRVAQDLSRWRVAKGPSLLRCSRRLESLPREPLPPQRVSSATI